jgi:PKD repeat protein
LSAVIWRNGTITDIGSICSPDFNSTAYAIATMPNGTELVVGECTTGFTVPVVWYSTANGSFAYEVLPLPPGVAVGRALAVNSSGQIVGQVNDRLPILWTFTPPAPNAPPTVTLAPSFSGDEGTSVPFSVAASDPEGAPLSYSWDFGDGAPPGSGSAPTHDYADNGSYTATVSVSDGVNTAVASAIVSIANVAPSATLQVPGVDVMAGQPFAVALSGATDPSTVDLAAGLTYAFDCENDGTFTAPSATPDALCSIAAPGSAIISARILDKDGGVTTYSGTITVVAPVNLPPTLAVGGPYAAQEGTAVTLGASGTDPEGQPLTYSWDFGDGSPAGSGASVTHAFPDNGSYTITVTTSDGTNSTSATTSATITNVAPTGAIVAPIGSSAPQGTVVLALGSLVEPSPVDAASLQYRFNCGSGFGPIVATPSTTCALPATGSRTLRIAVRDKDGGQSNYTKTITITNVGPSVTILSPTTVTIPAGSALTFSAAFTDPGTADNPWTARVNWGGGLGIQALGTVTPSVPFGASRIYPTPGTFTALVEVKDRFGAFATRGRITVVVQ